MVVVIGVLVDRFSHLATFLLVIACEQSRPPLFSSFYKLVVPSGAMALKLLFPA